MQLGDPGLELERLTTHPRTKPLTGDELGLLAYMQKSEGLPRLPLAARNPDNPIRCGWCPWGSKDILTTRDILNRRAKAIMAKNAQRSQDFAREVLIHLGFTLPEVIEREKAQIGVAGMHLGQDITQVGRPWFKGGEAIAPPVGDVFTAPTTERLDTPLTIEAPTRTIPEAAPPPVKMANAAALIPWALLALSVFRTFRG